jgi:pimeloyl-ACP methyl ester carboxylesterase
VVFYQYYTLADFTLKISQKKCNNPKGYVSKGKFIQHLMKKLLILVFAFIYTTANSQSPYAFDVDVIGKGRPVLLFPGFGCTGELWDETVASLSKKYECHVFTFAGFGNVPPVGTPWFSRIKEDVVSYVKSKKLKGPALVGHSLGGTLSFWLAADEPDLFSKVIAVDALPSSAALMIPNYKGDKIPYDNPQSSMMLSMDSASFASMNAQSVPFMCKNKEKHETIIHWMSIADRKTYVYGYIDMLNLDLREDIKKIKVPVTILAATSPNLTAVQKTYQEQFKQLPTVKIEYAPDAAHFVMYDQPTWFIEKLQSHLR